jgi:hypothetical protein
MVALVVFFVLVPVMVWWCGGAGGAGAGACLVLALLISNYRFFPR